MQGAYVAIYLTSTPSCTALSTLCLSPPPLFSHFSSGGKSVFLFFGLFPQSWLSSATCLLSHLTFTGAAFIPAQGALSGFSVRSTHVCVSWSEAKGASIRSRLWSVCLLACLLDWGTFWHQKNRVAPAMMNWLKSRILFCIVVKPIVLCESALFMYTGYSWGFFFLFVLIGFNHSLHVACFCGSTVFYIWVNTYKLTAVSFTFRSCWFLIKKKKSQCKK